MGIQYVWKGIINVCIVPISCMVQCYNHLTLEAWAQTPCFVVRQDSGVIGSSLFQHCKKQQVLSKHPGLRFVGFRFNHIQNNQRPKHLSCHCFWIQIPVSSWSIFLHSTANNSIHSDSHQPRILLSATRVCLRIGYSYPLVIENGDL